MNIGKLAIIAAMAVGVASAADPKPWPKKIEIGVQPPKPIPNTAPIRVHLEAQDGMVISLQCVQLTPRK